MRHARVIRARWAAVAVLALCAAIVPVALAAPTRILIIAVFNPITYGEDAYINGQLVGKGEAGQPVQLEQSAPPYTDWTPAAQGYADSQGFYSFQLQPKETMQYRASSDGVVSQHTVTVEVAPRMQFTARAIGRTTIRFSGTFSPALLGQTILVQRRGAFGTWVTVANPWLHNGSRFLGRVQARHRITLRAVFLSVQNYLGTYSRPVVAVPKADVVASRARASATGCRAPVVDAVTTSPRPLRAGVGLTLRVHGSASGAVLRSVDVRWGEDGKRDHFTLAPSYRKPQVTFTLRHRYATPGVYVPTVRVFSSCGRASRPAHPRLEVVE